nr:MAG TPA: hypothetical protein [Caudoviricetes sp.]
MNGISVSSMIQMSLNKSMQKMILNFTLKPIT